MTPKTIQLKRRAAKKRRQVTLWGLVIGAVAVLVGAYLFFAPDLLSKSAQTRYEAGQPGAGDLAPEFSLLAVGGETFSLANYRGQKNVLLFFQEGVGCDLCWQQSQELQAKRDFLSQRDVEVAIIAIDPLFNLEPVALEYGLTLPVLSDSDKSVSRLYDMLGFGMHPGFRPAHSFVLIGKDGTILWRADYGAPPRQAMYVPEQEIYDAVAVALR